MANSYPIRSFCRLPAGINSPVLAGGFEEGSINAFFGVFDEEAKISVTGNKTASRFNTFILVVSQVDRCQAPLVLCQERRSASVLCAARCVSFINDCDAAQTRETSLDATLASVFEQKVL